MTNDDLTAADQLYLYEAALSNTPDFIYVIGANHRFIYANKSLLTMWGHTLENVVGKTFLEIGYEPWHAEMHDREIDEVISTRKAFRGEIPFTGTYGRRVYDYIFAPIFNNKGEIIAISGTTRDITDTREAEIALRKSEESISIALETTEFVGIWDWNVVENRVTADERFATLYSVDPVMAAQGVPIEDFSKAIHPDDADTINEAIKRALQTGENFAEEYRLVQKNGDIRWVFAKGRAQRDANGSAIRFPGVTIDITERKMAEQNLLLREAQLAQITNAIPQQVWTSRPDGQLDFINEHCYEYVGDISVVDGVYNWLGVVHPADVNNSLDLWKKSIETGEPYECQQRLFHKASGQYRWNLTRSLPVRDQNGAIYKWYGTNTDIQALKEAEVKADAANLAKSEFLANMSHEIRTPMNAVIGLSNILSVSKPLTPRQRDYVSTLQTSADALLTLINDLLDIAKIEARTIELEKITFCLCQVIQEVISMLQPKAQEKGLKLTDDCKAAYDLAFIGDPGRIRQILLNLCSNAVKFTDSGSVELNVTITQSVGKTKWVNITVIDTGIGIAQDKLDSIFQKFVQGDSSINRKYGGTGLGLAITKTLAETMGGTISVKSELDKGSEFTVSIPLEVTAKVAAPVEDVVQVDTVEGESRPCVLLVEDYPANVLVASTFLDQFGFDCVVAVNGLEAIEKAKARKYVAILMDVQMYGLNGLEATVHIREYEKQNNLKAVPIIGMTAHALSGDRERCISAGMSDYISKPFNPAELEQKLRVLAELSGLDKAV